MRRSHWIVTLLCCGCGCLWFVAPLSADDDAKPAVLAARAATILERNCLQCHRGAGSASKAKFDVRSVKSMVDAGVIFANDPGSSLLWELAHRGTMPPGLSRSCRG